MILLIDNYCSFTYNQAHYFGDLGAELCIKRNDEITVSDIEKINPSHIVISSGPCTPNEAGISLDIVKHYAGKLPILGVCLGMQTIGQAFGGNIVHAKQVMHGKLSDIYHNSEGIFSGLPNSFKAVRYHSLVVDKNTLPDCLSVTAWTQNKKGGIDEVMGIKHKRFFIEGVQFHPESLLSEHGHQLLKNFIKTGRNPK